MSKTATLLIAASAIATASAAASDSVSFLGPVLDPIIGDGISNDNFIVVNNASEGIELGIKAHERFTGDLARTGNIYTANTGTTTSPTGLVGSTWNVTWVLNLTSGTLGSYDIEWLLDFDPTAGSSYTTIDVDNSAIATGAGASPIGAASENAAFSFWSVSVPTLVDASGYQAFDANATGTHDSIFRVKDKASGAVLAEAQIFVNVVPAPAAAAMLGLGGLVAARRRR